MRGDADAVSGKGDPHSGHWPRPRVFSSQPHTALQERSLVAACGYQAVHPGAPTTGQKKNPCSSEASEAHPQPITLGTLNTLLGAATLEGGQRYHGGDCSVVMAAVGGGKASSLFVRRKVKGGSHNKAGCGRTNPVGAHGGAMTRP